MKQVAKPKRTDYGHSLCVTFVTCMQFLLFANAVLLLLMFWQTKNYGKSCSEHSSCLTEKQLQAPPDDLTLRHQLLHCYTSYIKLLSIHAVDTNII